MPDDRTNPLLSYIYRLAAIQEDPRSDRELLQCFSQQQDDDAFTALVRRHGPMVWRVCWRVLGHEHDAEDVVQATFWLLARKAAKSRWQASVGNWLYGVAYHLALKAKAAVACRQAYEGRAMAQQPSADPAAELTLRESQALFDEELARLPEALRAPLVLCYLEGATRDEAARQLNCSLATFKRRLERGRERLRLRLSRRGVDLSTVLLAVGLSSSEATAGVPTLLLASAVKAVVARVTQSGVAGPVISSEALALAEGALRSMLMAKLKTLTLIVTATFMVVGGSVAMHQKLSSKLPQDLPVSQQQVDKPRPGIPAIGGDEPREKQATQLDCYGDPLPEHALARMGTTRLWHGGTLWNYPAPLVALAFSLDGKILASQSTSVSGCLLWDVATGKVIRRLEKTGTYFHLLGFSPNGRTLVTTNWNQAVSLWDVVTGKLLRTYPGSTKDDARCRGITFLPNGEILAVEDFFGVPANVLKREQRVWEITTGREISRLSGQSKIAQRERHSAAFSPDGKILAAVEEEKKIIQLWEVTTGKEICQLPESGAYAVVFSPDCKILAVSDPQKVSLWEVATGKKTHILKTESSAENILPTFSPDSKTLLTGEGSKQKACLWNVATGRVIRLFDYARAQRAVFSPNGKMVATANGAGAICLWDVATGKEIGPHRRNRGGIRSLDYSHDGKTLASVGSGNGVEAVLLWEVATGKEIRQLPKSIGSAEFVVHSPDGKLLVSGNSRSLKLCDIATGKQIFEFFTQGVPGYAAFSPDGKLLATLKIAWEKNRMEACVGEISTGKKLYELGMGSPSNSGYWKIAFSPDGRSMAATVSDGTIALWEIATGVPIGQLNMQKQPVPYKNHKRHVESRSIAFSSDGKILFDAKVWRNRDGTGTTDAAITAWAIATGQKLYQKPLQNFEARSNERWRIVSFTFSPDGRMVAAGGDRSGQVHLWETATGEELGQLTGHRAVVHAVAFSPDGKTLASGSDDITCLIWDITPWTQRVQPVPALPVQALSQQQLEAAWRHLALVDAAKAYRAIHTLSAAPKQAVPWLKARIRPIAPLSNPQQLTQWIADLDHNQFLVRIKAQQEIATLREVAIPALRKALTGQPPLEVRRRLQALLAKLEPKLGAIDNPQRLREIRAVQILESIGTSEAQQALQALAKGVPEASLTQDAQAAWGRLNRRFALKP